MLRLRSLGHSDAGDGNAYRGAQAALEKSAGRDDKEAKDISRRQARAIVCARAETRALVKSAAARRPYCIRRFGRRGDSAPSAARTVRCRLAPQAGGWRRSRE